MRVSELIKKLREIEENGGGEDFIDTYDMGYYTHKESVVHVEDCSIVEITC